MSNEAPTDALRLVPSRDDGLRVGQAILEAHSQWEKEHGVTGSQNPWQEQHVILLGQAAILAAPASPLPEGGGDILWMMHVRGPDDIYPAPDYKTAVAWCDYVNDVLAKAVPGVMTKAVPAIWTLSPQEHAAYLPEAIKGWTLPAAPTGDA